MSKTTLKVGLLIRILSQCTWAFVLSASSSSFASLNTAPGHAGQAGLWDATQGIRWVYDYRTSTQVTQLTTNASNYKDPPRTQSEVHLETLWTSREKDLNLLHFISKDPKKRSSDFYALVEKTGRIREVWLPEDDPPHEVNRKLALVTLFQFDPSGSAKDPEDPEDILGQCETSYETHEDPQGRILVKTQENCKDPQMTQRSKMHFSGPKVTQTSQTHYKLTEEHLQEIGSKSHLRVLLGSEADLSIFIEQSLVLIGRERSSDPLDLKDPTDLSKILKRPLKRSKLQLTHKSNEKQKKAKRSFAQVLKDLRPTLTHLGSLTSARSFLTLVNAARGSSTEDLVKVLRHKSNKDLLGPLSDILGHCNLLTCHRAFSQLYHFDEVKNLDPIERYLWALSLTPEKDPKDPGQEQILEDLLEKLKKTQNIPAKIQDTLVTTIGSLAKGPKMTRVVEEFLTNYLDAAGSLEEKSRYLRGLMNLGSGSLTVVEGLLRRTQGPDSREVVAAWRTLRRCFDPKNTKISDLLRAKVLRRATRTFLQLDKEEDSSARTLALDLLLERGSPELRDPKDPKNDIFGSEADLTWILLSELRQIPRNHREGEVRQYVLEKLSDLPRVKAQIVRQDPTINNYHVFSRRGLSVAMTRVLRAGASISTVQEIQHGFVRRGTVSLALGSDPHDPNDPNDPKMAPEVFSLGIFSSGLGALMNNDAEKNAPDAQEEEVLAGMELTILGRSLRPFSFFKGQGELMGHVWSGTASERTTAFQSLILLEDQEWHIPLSNGEVLVLGVQSAASMDLSGEIQISLWHRNADALVEQKVAIFAKSTLFPGEFSQNSRKVWGEIILEESLEPKLELSAKVDFASPEVALCMRLQQPEVLNSRKYSRKNSRKKIFKQIIPGQTFALNLKNSEMCNEIFPKN